MCGIAGEINFEGRPASALALQRMISAIRHRGPDATGTYRDSCCALGHARLSIIDLASGKQPMASEDGRYQLVFNGEIFNYLELRSVLEGRGYAFCTHSDTEVLLQAYRHYGAECVHHFNGQWAFAIWDRVEEALFLSRDRSGVRPLFYSEQGSRLVFGSEIKSLAAHPDVQLEMDATAIHETFTYWFCVAPRTPFQGVFELPPGHSAVFSRSGLKVSRYWQPQYAFDLSDRQRQQELADELHAVLLDATRLRLRADVPVAAYLSGGLDSTLTTALIREVSTSPLVSFSIAFEDEEFDERKYQDLAARELGVEHRSFVCTKQEICDSFPAVVRHAEKPILRTAPAPMFALSRHVHEAGFKVVMTGEGADELFGGYDIFKEAKLRSYWARDLHSTRRAALLRRLYPYLPGLQQQSTAYLREFFKVRETDLDNMYFSHLPRWEMTSSLKQFFSDDFRDRVCEDRRYKAIAENASIPLGEIDPFCRAQYLETAFLLPGYILSSQGDRMALAHSVEGRFPFLDVRVMEFANRLPPTLKMRVLTEKYLLKRAARGLIPGAIVARSKQPYRAPDIASFYDAESKRWRDPYVDNMLSREAIDRYGVFDRVAVSALVKKIRKGGAVGIRDNMAFVGILSTQLLVNEFQNSRGTKGHAEDERRDTAVCDR